MLEYQRHANEVRERLRNPPNAIRDTDIRMHGGHPVEMRRAFARSPLPDDELHKRCLEFFNKCIAQQPEPRFRVPKTPRPFLAQAIITAVASHYDLSANEMLSPRRQPHAVLARHVAMWLMKELTPLSTSSIAQRVGGRDHTTIMYGIKKIDSLRKTDPDLQAKLDQFLSALRIPPKESGNAEIPRRYRKPGRPRHCGV
jgi:hypothetical protein